MTAPGTTRPPLARTGAEPVVLGDGTTAGSRARSRWRRYRWLLAVAAVVAVGGLAQILPAPSTSTVALAPDNPRDDGARAVAEVLREQGVSIRYVRTTGEALAAAGPGSTLLVTSDWFLSSEQVEAVAGTEANLVLLDPSSLLPATVDGLDVRWSSGSAPRSLEAGCTDPDALAAGTVTAGGAGVYATGDTAPAGTTLCFPTSSTGPPSYLYSVSEVDGRRVTVLGDARLVTNASVAAQGNAALVLRALGRTADLVWYVPSPSDTTTSEEASSGGFGAMLPPAARMVLLQLLVVGLALALWRGRRLGRVVTEPLPVVVRSGETTRGRGRLYRASRSYGHAAAALRAGTADRCARRLGLPRTAAAPEVITAVARASGRDETAVQDVLYGPPPTTDAGLENLARRLDQLESEVHPT